MTRNHKYEDRRHPKRSSEDQRADRTDLQKKMTDEDTEVKNAHASGMGSLEKSDENQIENLRYEEDDDYKVY